MFTAKINFPFFEKIWKTIEYVKKLIAPTITLRDEGNYYQLKVEVADPLKDKLKIYVQPGYIRIAFNLSYRKIYFEELVDTTAITKEYSNECCTVKIKKLKLSPEEKINKWAISLGF